MKIHCISNIFLFFLIHAVCGENFYFTKDSSEVVENDEGALHFYDGLMSREHDDHYCECNTQDCECCYTIGKHTVCSMTKVVTLKDEGDELAIQGRITINNGSILTYFIKFKEIPKMCYHHDKFETCFDLKHEEAGPNKLKVCGHIMARYSSTVLLNIDLFCKTFEVRKAVESVGQPKDNKNTFVTS